MLEKIFKFTLRRSHQQNQQVPIDRTVYILVKNKSLLRAEWDHLMNCFELAALAVFSLAWKVHVKQCIWHDTRYESELYLCSVHCQELQCIGACVPVVSLHSSLDALGPVIYHKC